MNIHNNKLLVNTRRKRSPRKYKTIDRLNERQQREHTRDGVKIEPKMGGKHLGARRS